MDRFTTLLRPGSCPGPSPAGHPLPCRMSDCPWGMMQLRVPPHIIRGC